MPLRKETRAAPGQVCDELQSLRRGSRPIGRSLPLHPRSSRAGSDIPQRRPFSIVMPCVFCALCIFALRTAVNVVKADQPVTGNEYSGFASSMTLIRDTLG